MCISDSAICGCWISYACHLFIDCIRLWFTDEWKCYLSNDLLDPMEPKMQDRKRQLYVYIFAPKSIEPIKHMYVRWGVRPIIYVFVGLKVKNGLAAIGICVHGYLMCMRCSVNNLSQLNQCAMWSNVVVSYILVMFSDRMLDIHDIIIMVTSEANYTGDVKAIRGKILAKSCRVIDVSFAWCVCMHGHVWT